MSNYTIQSGDTLSQIVANKYGLKNWSDIKATYLKIAELNKISNPNLIFTGNSLNLPDSINSVFEIQKNNEQVALDKGITEKSANQTLTNNVPTVEEKTTPLNDWYKECADSIVDIDENGNPIYDKDVNPFDMVGQEFTDAVKTKDFNKAGEIYKQKAIDTAKLDIALIDTDGDGAISPEEQVKKDKAEAEKKYGPLDQSLVDEMKTISLRANVFMDLDKNKKVDEKEYASFLYAMDSNNDKKTANGKITRDEYAKTVNYFEKKLTEEAGTFRGTMRACFKSFFGFDPAAGK